MEFKRAERVAGLILEELSKIIQREVQDPRVAMSTITQVKLSDDLKNAKIYFVCETKKREEAEKGFERSQGFIKKKLSERLTLRYMPRLKFYYDTSLDYSGKIEKLLKNVKVDEIVETEETEEG